MPVPAGREGDGGDSASDDRRLFVQVERETEIDHLAESAWMARRNRALLLEPCGRGLNERRGR